MSRAHEPRRASEPRGLVRLMSFLVGRLAHGLSEVGPILEAGRPIYLCIFVDFFGVLALKDVESPLDTSYTRLSQHDILAYLVLL